MRDIYDITGTSWVVVDALDEIGRYNSGHAEVDEDFSKFLFVERKRNLPMKPTRFVSKDVSEFPIKKPLWSYSEEHYVVHIDRANDSVSITHEGASPVPHGDEGPVR